MQKNQTPKPNYRNIPDPFPPVWAIAYGQDNQGFWADLQVEQVLQRMRWMPSGWFLMGSPESEHKRSSNEKQHEVTLSKGYWLADTACTQKLWDTVMGDNPAHFTEDFQNPVEQVSWDDVQIFLEKLNHQIPSLDAHLPTEAQWEYACRAGTSTPFSFGEDMTATQVNYYGKNPYRGASKQEYREKTVPVKALPENQWGLFQMHGNVLEWCQDWYGEYPVEPVQDPKGKQQDEYRVLRGGSWIDFGQSVRSAYRSRRTPDNRNYLIGFRFSLGQVTDKAVAKSNKPRK